DGGRGQGGSAGTMASLPEGGKRGVEGALVLVLRDETDFEEGIKGFAVGNINEWQALGQLDNAPRPNIQPQLPEQAGEVHNARQQQLAACALGSGEGGGVLRLRGGGPRRE